MPSVTSAPTDLRGQQAAVVGAGIEGMSLARWFTRQGAQVTVHLARPYDEIHDDGALAAQAAEIQRLGARLAAGDDYLSGVTEADIIGVVQSATTYKYPKNVAALDAARARGIPIVTNLMLFFALCPCPIVGITGTNGKTTTTEMTDAILRAGGLPLRTGGNIGASPLDDVDSLTAEDLVLLELSNYQLAFLDRSPHVAAVTNLAPDHLVDYGGSFDEYIAAKRHILDYQTEDDWAVLNWDDPILRQWGAATTAQPFAFNLAHRMEPGAYLWQGKLAYRRAGVEHTVMPAAELPAPGLHNVANALCAIAIGALHDVPAERMADALRGYKTGAHRLEQVGTARGVAWINDSKSTTPASTVAAIRAFPDRRIILLAGGMDKGLPIDELLHTMRERVATLVAFGAWGPSLAEAAQAAGIQVVAAAGVADAVETAARLARPGDVALFSPGGTSFDAYPSYARRGEHFAQLVRELDPRSAA